MIKLILGQVWRYATRSKDTGSSLRVLKIDDHFVDNIVHVEINNVRMVGRGRRDKIISISHMPFLYEIIEKAVVELVNYVAVDHIIDGYDYWLAAYNSGNAGVWRLDIKQALDLTEETMKK